MLTLFLAAAMQPSTDYQLDLVPGQWGRLNHRGIVWIADRGPVRYMLTGPAHNGPGTWRFGVPHANGSSVYEAKGWDGSGAAVFTLITPPQNPKTNTKIIIRVAP